MGLIKDIRQKVIDRYYLYKYIFPFIERNKNREVTPDNGLCLFSFPRSGSTWLAEILLQMPNSCLIDEPLQRNKILTPNDIPDHSYRKIKEIADLDFWFYQPIPRNTDDTNLRILFQNILCGRSLSVGLYNDYGFKRLMQADYYITKFNYGQMLSPWFHRHFDSKSIYLIRSPFACIGSMKLHPYYNKVKVASKVLLPEFKYNEIYLEHENQYKKIKSMEGLYAFLWCINNKEGFFKNKGENIFHLFYEDLLLDFEKKLIDVFKFLKIDLPGNVNELKVKPSLSTLKGLRSSINTESQLHSWKEVLNKQNVTEIKNMLEYFDIAEYQLQSIPNHQC